MDDFKGLASLALPALGGTALVLGLAYGLATRTYDLQVAELAQVQADAKADEIAAANASFENLELVLRTVEATPVAAGRGDPLPRFTSYDLGRGALKEEVAVWDIDIRPDGQGLPVGSGDVWTGEEIFAEQCAACHGDFGEAVGRWPVLAGGHDTLDEEDPVKTIGSYWPYLSTVYDYINRAMPFGYAQSLEPDDVYAITAYLLYVNDLVDDDFELDRESFREFKLPNEENFYFDDRATTEYVAFTAEPCMSDCKAEVEITARAMVVDVTPDEDGEEEETNASPVLETEEVQVVVVEEVAADDPLEAIFAIQGDVEYGAYLSSECTACHQASNAASEIPTIVNWPTQDFIIAMHSYKTGERTHPVMQMIAGRLVDEEIAALAAYFAELEN